jgi:hypothetical protein
VLGFEAASHWDRLNLQNWVDGNGCIAREETAYLARTEDLVRVVSPNDSAVIWLGSLAEDGCVYFRECFGRVRNPHSAYINQAEASPTHIFPVSSIARAARILITPFIIVLLLMPVIICSFVNSLTARLVVITIATTSFMIVLSGLTKTRTVELAVAGAT